MHVPSRREAVIGAFLAYASCLVGGFLAACPYRVHRREVVSAPKTSFTRFYRNNMTADQWAELRLDLNKVFAWAPSPRELAANAFPYGSGIVRLSWHDAGSANVETGTGGPHGDLRFSQVYSYSENLGLQRAVDILEPIYQKFNGSISHADLWSFAAAVFITNNNGPEIAWRPGRADAPSFAADPIPPFTHPNATMDASDYRPIFQRMGFNDREIVALIGAHNIGWASKNNSDYVGGWTTEPWWFSNQFFTRLLLVDTAFYTATTNDGQNLLQWQDPNQFMMFPSDRQLQEDSSFKQYVKIYAEDQDQFFSDFAAAFRKLQELNVGAGLGEYVSTRSPNRIEYKSGAPVLSAPSVHLYFIYYGNWSDSSQTQKLESVGNGISSTDWWSTVQAYFSFSESENPTFAYVTSNISVAGTLHDNVYSAGKNLTGDMIPNYIASQIERKALPNDTDGVYVFFFTDDISESSSQGSYCSDYCAYHNAFKSFNHTYPYIVVGLPEVCSVVCNNPVMPTSGPTGDVAVDSAISSFTNMLARTATNPAGVKTAWFDRFGREPTDMCFYNYGTTYENDDGPFNLMIGTYPSSSTQFGDPSSSTCVFNFDGLQNVYNSTFFNTTSNDEGDIQMGFAAWYAWLIGALSFVGIVFGVYSFLKNWIEAEADRLAAEKDRLLGL